MSYHCEWMETTRNAVLDDPVMKQCWEIGIGQCPHCYAYEHGIIKKPHYPVPAIKVIRDVEFQHDRIITWYRWPGGVWTYRYLYVK